VSVEIIVKALSIGDGARVLYREQLIEHMDVRAEAFVGRYPVNGALDLTAVGRHTVAAFEIGGANYFLYSAVRIIFNVLAANDIRAHQPHLAVRLQAEIFRRRAGREVLGVDIQITGESDLTGA